MFTSFSLQNILSRRLALAVMAGSACVAAGAQTAIQTSAPATTVAPAVDFQFPAAETSAPGTGALFSDSASASPEDAGASATQLNLASLENGIKLPGLDAQYGRRRYGAPRYRGGNTNADGSQKYTAYAGVGLTLPVGSNSNYLTTSYGIQGGVGRNFNKHFGVNVEFDYDRFGMTGATIAQQSFLYTGSYVNQYGIDANSHIWNFSVQPTYQIYSGEGLGAYLTAGVGFYHKVANFTAPQEESDYYGDVFDVNENFDHYTSNAPGFDGGVGLTYKFSHFSSEKLYAEVRYVYVDNSARPGITVATTNTYAGYNFFPQNSNTTAYIPIKFGVRF